MTTVELHQLETLARTIEGLADRCLDEAGIIEDRHAAHSLRQQAAGLMTAAMLLSQHLQLHHKVGG